MQININSGQAQRELEAGYNALSNGYGQGVAYLTNAWLYFQGIVLVAFLLRDAAGAASDVAFDTGQAQTFALAAFAPVIVLRVRPM